MSDEERIYPCEKCGLMRTKSEGGTTFTLCDKCFDEYCGGHIKKMADAVGGTIEQDKHSFTRSQAIEFAEWCSENGYEYQLNGVWTNRNFTDPVGTRFRYTTYDLYSQFLDYQKKQQEGRGE